MVKDPARPNEQTRDRCLPLLSAVRSHGVRQRPFARPYVPIILSKETPTRGSAQTDHCVLYKVSSANGARIKGPQRHAVPGTRTSSSALCHRTGLIYVEFGQRPKSSRERNPYTNRRTSRLCIRTHVSASTRNYPAVSLRRYI